MTTQNEQDNEVLLNGGISNTGKNKQNFKRIIVGFVIVLLIFIGSCSMLKGCGGKVGQRQTVQEQINAMVAADLAAQTVLQTPFPKDFGDEINEIVDKIGKETTQYADNLIDKINTLRMPEDFRTTYRNHAKAWKKKADLCVSHPHLPTGVLSGMWKILSGKYPEVMTWAAQYDASTEEIRETWNEVIKIGAQYGVPIQ